MAIVKLSLQNIDQVVENNDIVIIDFWAPWCAPCRSFAPTFESVSEKFPDVIFGKVNTEEEQALAVQYQIRSIPTLMIFREKIIIYRQSGSLPAHYLEDVLNKAKALDMNMVHAEVAKQSQAQA